jgi:WD40 repeat protein/tRNA A-37 threonylcarbamoyl transferase component Bud32
VRPADSSVVENGTRPRAPDDSHHNADPATVPIHRRNVHFSPVPATIIGDWPRVRSYEILSVIGTGGMGIVYKAMHLGLRRTVALKMLRGSALADPEFRQRFAAEAEAVARLQHPNIIQVFEVGSVDARPGESDFNPFIALEFVEGGSLIRRTDKPQPPLEAARIVEKLARAVHSAHQLGVIHRDLKPANVLLTQDGEPKIADFGLAKQVGPERDSADRFVTQAGMVLGTPEYMAPEQANGDHPTAAIDIYALGVILYELLTARVPFQAATAFETLALARTQEPVSPRRLQPGVPRDLDTICLKCLQKEPARRYSSAEALAADLRRVCEGRTILARRATGPERLARWCWRNPVVAASLIVVVGTFLGAFALVSRSYWLAEEARQEEVKQRQESERKELAERRERYRANLIAAASALQDHDVVTAGRLIEAVPEEYRNWEGRHLHSRLDAARVVLPGPDDRAQQAVVSADGRRAALYSDQGAVWIWDTIGRRRILHLDSHLGLTASQFSSDGQTFAYLGREGRVVLVDLDSGRERLRIGAGNEPPVGFELSTDGKRVVTIEHDKSVSIWDAASGRRVNLLRPREPRPEGIVLARNGRHALYRTDDWKMLVWDLDTGEEREIQNSRRQEWHSIWFNPAGTRVMTVQDYRTNIIQMWDVATGREVRSLTGHGNSITAHAFSPDGSRLATASRDQTIRLWNAETGEPIAILRGHRGWVHSVSFNADGKRLVSGSLDHTVHIWDTASAVELVVLHGHKAEVTSVAYSADGAEIVSASRDGTVRIWDAHAAESGNVLRGHTSFVYRVAFHPDGERVASSAWDGTVRLWEASTGRQTALLSHGDEKIVGSVAFDPTGRLLASRTRTAVRIWNIETGAELRRWNFPLSSYRDTQVVFSPDGRFLAAGCETGVVRLWNVDDGREVATLRGHRDDIRDLAFSPDGQRLASAGEVGDRTIRIWDLSTLNSIQVLEGHTDAVYALAFSTDGRWLASGSMDGTVRLWDSDNWSVVSVLKHGPNVYSVAFTRDNTRLACACADNSIRFWDTSTFQEVAVLRGHADYVHSLAFSPDGTRMASASGDFTVRIWDTLPPTARAR